jgi:hypothetical protein
MNLHKLIQTNPEAAINRQKEDLESMWQIMESFSANWVSTSPFNQQLFTECADYIKVLSTKLNPVCRTIKAGDFPWVAKAIWSATSNDVDILELSLIDAIGYYGTTDLQLKHSFGENPFDFRVNERRKALVDSRLSRYVIVRSAQNLNNPEYDEFPDTAVTNAKYVYCLNKEGLVVLERYREKMNRSRPDSFEHEKFYNSFQRLMSVFYSQPRAVCIFLYLTEEPQLRNVFVETLLNDGTGHYDLPRIARILRSIFEGPFAHLFKRSKLQPNRASRITLQLSEEGACFREGFDLTRF